MSKHKHHPADQMIHQALQRVTDGGISNASDSDKMLAGFDWLADKLNTQHQTSIFVRLRGPAVTGGGSAAVIWAALQVLATRG